jgi:hypothetical protein
MMVIRAGWSKRMRALAGIGILLFPCGAPSWSAAEATRAIQIQKRGEQTVAFPGISDRDAAPRVNRPYFDGAGQLRWADALVHEQATGSCDTHPLQENPKGYPIYPRRTVLLSPRVDVRLCSRKGASSESTAIGSTDDGHKGWEREIVFRSGMHRLDQYLIGSSREGLVLSSLEVWSPDTGRTIMPAPTRLIPSESRAVPLYAYTGAALYHPTRRTIFVYDAEVTLTSSRGGLYEIKPSTGSKTLIHPVASTLLRGFDRIEEMALMPGGRYLCLAQRLSWRGPTDVSVTILDLSTKRLLFHERFCHGTQDTCADPHVVVEPSGAIGFSYSNMNRREHYLVLYDTKG